MRATPRKLFALASAGTTLALATATVALATAPSGETPTPLARGTLNTAANVNVKVTGGSVTIKTQGALDALVLEITLAPGGTGGWHSHAGPLISIVKHGTLTMLDGTCTRHDIPAGHAMISPGGTTEKDENKGTTPVVFDVTFLIPHSVTSPRIDQSAPAGCTA
jgi:quercetin dioxygenase-like cupin family protein